MSTDIRPVQIPVQKFIVLDQRGVAVGFIEDTQADRALSMAQALYGPGVYLRRAGAR